MHKCIHDEVQAGVQVVRGEISQPHSSLHEPKLSEKPRASLRPRRSTKQRGIVGNSVPQPIKIKTWIPAESAHLSESENRRLEAAVEEAVRTVSSILSVNRSMNPLLLSRDFSKYCKFVWKNSSSINHNRCGKANSYYRNETCLDVTIPDDHLSGCEVYPEADSPHRTVLRPEGAGLPDVDFVFYLQIQATDKCRAEPVLAYAVRCQTDRDGRPVAGAVVVCRNRLTGETYSHQTAVQTVIHELLHVLGFSKDLFSTWKDCSSHPDNPCSPRGKVTHSDGSGQTKIYSPSVISAMQKHLLSSDPELGGPLEDLEAAADGASSHWESRLLQGSIMGPVLGDSTTVRIDPITLAAFQDTGWYTVDLRRGQSLVWGNGEGKSFGSTKTCKDNSSSFFCTGSGLGCHFLHLHKGECQTDPYLDGCRVYKPLKNGSECWKKDNSRWSTEYSSSGEMFGFDSRCFFSSLSREEDFVSSTVGRCYRHRCTGTNRYQIQVSGSRWVDCPAGGAVQIKGYRGSVFCPDKRVCVYPDVFPPLKDDNSSSSFIKRLSFLLLHSKVKECRFKTCGQANIIFLENVSDLSFFFCQGWRCCRLPSTIGMTSFIVNKFKEKLENLSISDYQGLESPGLTCYLNCVLQVLFWTEEFREAVKRCSGNNSTSIDPLLTELFENLEKKRSKTHKIVKILGITDVYEQRDAAEYLEKILCHTSPEASKIFKGELNHKTTCHGCRSSSYSKNFFWILPLAVKDFNHKTYDVQRGLEGYFKVQKVSEENQLYCNNCNKKQDADLECELTQSPEALTLLLKRFTFDSKQKRYVKLQCKADVAQTLHFASCRYDLYAVVDHFGDMTGGHYTAEIKSFETGSWYCFDDSIVKNVNSKYFKNGENVLRSHTAYLLMYMKGSPRPNTTDQSDPRTPEEGCQKNEQTFEPLPPLISGSCSGEDARLLKEEHVNQGAAMQHPDINQRGAEEKTEFICLITDRLNAESLVRPNGMSQIKPVTLVRGSSPARVRKDLAATAFTSNYRGATSGAENERKALSSVVLPSKRCSNSFYAVIQPTERHASADVDRRSRSLTRNKEKSQRAVSANSRLERPQTSTPREQSLRREKIPRTPWK
ncbi:hypothetical protein OJAV_G00181010 [Oryzias javanicus]|uniref:USP domain-containing protein n=1 Tax=Oryzias javanicus TaxID=123683 RepID=A0A3S2PT92_ORYJA|nr:hypothetical protein OJAV_G00181010 [Oryzias javanicus]